MKSLWALWAGALVWLCGCSSFLEERAPQPPKHEETPDKPHTRLIGDIAVPFGLHPVRLENISIVTGLADTGSEPPPSPERSELEAEMRTRGVESPTTVLGSKKVSLVRVRGWLRPGIQKGDRFDIEVAVPGRSETTSLAGGFLLETQLKEMAILDGQVHSGKAAAIGQGPVLVEPSAKGEKDRVALCRGMVLGGGVVLKSRQMGLVLKPNHQTVPNAAQIANSINKRFHIMLKGVQTGVAKARNDQFVELHVHPRYKQNVERYVHVLRAIALRENSAEESERIAKLKTDLLNPDLVGETARQLEAVGREGIPALLAGIKSPNSEVRFYAAEALAYLDQREAAPVLAEAARQSPAFRVFALTALSAMDDRAAYDSLRELLNVPSAETRYGAFRSIWAMNSRDPLVVGDPSIKEFSYHVLDTQGPAMLHVSRSRRAEIVLFGRDQRFRTPLVANAGNQIMVTSTNANEISVSRFVANQPDQKRVVSTRIDDVIRAIVDLGGTYPDVVRALEEAKASDGLATRFEVDALPEPGRVYDRFADDASAAESQRNSADNGAAKKKAAKLGAPDLFSKDLVEEPEKEVKKKPDSKAAEGDDSKKKTPPTKGFFARMLGSDSE